MGPHIGWQHLFAHSSDFFSVKIRRRKKRINIREFTIKFSSLFKCEPNEKREEEKKWEDG